MKKIKKIVVRDKNNKIVRIERFNKRGYLIKRNDFYDPCECKPFTKTSVEKYKYDKNNNCISKKVYLDGVLNSKIIRKYKNGVLRLMKTIEYPNRKDRRIIKNNITEIEYYNEKGLLVKQHSNNFWLESDSYFEYDENDKLLSIRDDYSTTLFSYDENGNCISETYINDDDVKVYEITFNYDDNHNRIRILKEFTESALHDGHYFGPHPLIWEYKYNEKNQKTWFKDSNGIEYEYKYDDNGNIIYESSEGMTTKSKYDNNGNLIRKVTTFGDETIIITKIFDKNDTLLNSRITSRINNKVKQDVIITNNISDDGLIRNKTTISNNEKYSFYSYKYSFYK